LSPRFSRRHAADRPAIPPPTITTGIERRCEGGVNGAWSRRRWPTAQESLTNEPSMGRVVLRQPRMAAPAAPTPLGKNPRRVTVIGLGALGRWPAPDQHSRSRVDE